MFAKVVSVIAAMLAGAALAVSLLHAGPAGRAGTPGPPGPAGKAAAAVRLRYGVCWIANYQTSGGLTWVDSLSIDSAQVTDGVYQCPQGETFVSIVPSHP